MKKNDKEKLTPKKVLLGLLEIIGELILTAIFAGVGFVVAYLLGGDKLVDRLVEDEFIILVGIGVIAAGVGVALLAVYCIKKLVRFLVKKARNKHM